MSLRSAELTDIRMIRSASEFRRILLTSLFSTRAVRVTDARGLPLSVSFLPVGVVFRSSCPTNCAYSVGSYHSALSNGTRLVVAFPHAVLLSLRRRRACALAFVFSYGCCHLFTMTAIPFPSVLVHSPELRVVYSG